MERPGEIERLLHAQAPGFGPRKVDHHQTHCHGTSGGSTLPQVSACFSPDCNGFGRELEVHLPDPAG